MSPDMFLAIRAFDGLMTFLINAGVSVDKFMALKAQSATGTVTDEQIRQLAETARSNVARL